MAEHSFTLGQAVVVHPDDTLLVGLPELPDLAVADATAGQERAGQFEELPARLPGVDVVLLRGVTSLGVVRYDEPAGDDPAHELVAAREELERVRVDAQLRCNELAAEFGRHHAALARRMRRWADHLDDHHQLDPELRDATVASMRRIAGNLNLLDAGGHPVGPPGYKRIAAAIKSACDVAGLQLAVQREQLDDNPVLVDDPELTLARVLHKSDLIDWFAFAGDSEPDAAAPNAADERASDG